ncbi:AraC family transcriptional regulator [Sunxiuqinia sp. A32]|uniref:AraC family transcriptional regulator n=1 Tax=Sunxiuqinia sp. A32 TaxID=3461496 RepID=UPI0040455BBF
MIPHVERISKNESESFFVGKYSNKWFERVWHYHPEFELLMITSGDGTRIIGNDRSHFEKGDLVLLAGNIPHAWFSDSKYFDPESKKICSSVYVQFERSIFGNRFINLPEMNPVAELLLEAKLGLRLIDDPSNKIRPLLIDLPNIDGIDRLLSLIKILELFKCGSYQPIVHADYNDGAYFTKSERIKKVHEYVMNYYMEDVSLQDVAALVGMNVSSFCRYFKSVTNKTFSQYLKEIRIDFAQQLLINTNLSSSQIAYECGFSSVAYFNQSFKGLSKFSPLAYREAFKIR